MALDPEVLLNYPIPEVRQRYSRRDSAFYALSLGLGGDPLDERQLAYVDPCRDLQALPCMALVLGHPGFWLAIRRLAWTRCAWFTASSAWSGGGRCRRKAR